MSALDRVLVGAAVAVSPAAHRAARREQWLADVRDAHELDLSPTALAFGAFTTALFHRRAGHRSTWGDTMTALPTPVRSAPHTIRTVPVLVALAVVSLLVEGAWLILQPNYGYESASDRVLGITGTWSLVFFVPGAAIALAALTLRTSARRRRLGASMIVAAAVGGALQPILTPPTSLPIALVPVVLALAGWLVAARAARWTWVLLVLPVAVFALQWAGVLYPLVPVRWSPFLVTLPHLAIVLAGAVASRFSTDAPAVVEAHGEALVDKTS
ncbi:hypothetical protein [Curtobacterium sp. VKM Ac-2884]|uniref:hypothetical protein n=1 Tax=Curtobacterium sp. VKM Ac-2884 TaxID=2783818 RepID=UPI001889D0B2|nr:hypothetical protein [Curtobacterium sp. VKM Ac-2884]MBF4604650.1 hypothetical protein [Curtobacterium sp. VKM Ac-2884]